MTEIYVIRHAQAEGNLYHMMQGTWDGDVTALGLRQIDALAERFRHIPIDALYSSDLYRTRLTASAITRWHDVPIQLDKRLREMHVGPWETQFFANVGGEEMAHIAPELREGAVGPGMAFNQQWKGEAEVVKTIVCGDSYFAEHEKDAKEQVLAWVKEAKPDLFIAGPAFNAGRYGYACANVALAVKTELGIPVLTETEFLAMIDWEGKKGQ